ncbi:hypothetical protein G6F35_018895 [Rhizopus arrhizus]|nr:hypothetical protein G6F35_018895 [Rhizopus arrhizus]
MRQEHDAQRDAQQPACDERQQMRHRETAPYRERGQQLSGQRAEHGHRGRQPGVNGPRPERHGHHPEPESRQALHKPCGHGADQDQHI